MRITIDTNTGLVGSQALTTAPSSQASFSRVSQPVRASQTRIEVGFTNSTASNTLNLGADPALVLRVKRGASVNLFDQQTIAGVTSWTRFSETGSNGELDYYYAGIADFSAPVFRKLLGGDTLSEREVITITCAADVAGSMEFAQAFIHAPDGGEKTQLVLYISTAPAAAPAGYTQRSIQIGINDSGSDIAATIAADAAVTGYGYTLAVAGSVVTLTADDKGSCDFHYVSDGLALTVTKAGSLPFAVEDENYADVIAEFSYELSGNVQLSEVFGVRVQNCLRRDSASEAIPAGGTNVRYGTQAITSGQASATITFSSPHSSSGWKIQSLAVVYTGGGTPDVLSVGTVKKTAATGMTCYLSGTAPDGNYSLEYRTIET